MLFTDNMDNRGTLAQLNKASVVKSVGVSPINVIGTQSDSPPFTFSYEETKPKRKRQLFAHRFSAVLKPYPLVPVKRMTSATNDD